jgi:hypothetical protein
MSELAFLSPAFAEAGYRSPLERALAGTQLRDLSSLGKVEVRGELDEATLGDVEVVRISPARSLVLCEAKAAPALAARLNGIDLSAALAGLVVQGERLLRRFADLDLERLPAVGAVAGVRCTVLRDENEFRLFFPQEYADHVAAVVLDAAAGLR